MANCLGGQYGGGILRYVPKIRTPSLRLYNKRQMLIWGKSVDRPILTNTPTLSIKSRCVFSLGYVTSPSI